MATSKKTTTTTAKKASDFPAAYIRLRTVLDSLELGAIRYCLKDTNAKKREERAAEIEAILMPLISKLKDKTIKPGDTEACGDGLFNCGGVCVPYQCPAK